MKRSAIRIEFSGRWALIAALALPGFALAQTAAAPATAASATIKIGFVDMQRLLDNAPQLAQAQAQVIREFSPNTAVFKNDDAKLAALKQRYERDSAIMTKEDADALKREIEATERANKRAKDEVNAALNDRKKALGDKAYNQVIDTIVEYARTQGYDLVVPSPALYASPRVDITDAILQRLKQASTSSPDTTKP